MLNSQQIVAYGEPLAAGDMLIQRDLAETLRAMAAQGAGAIHGGSVGQAIDAAMQALDKDFQPISDARASADYRRRVCRNLLRRFYDECAGDQRPRLYAYGRA